MHCARDGKHWRITVEKPSELANDIEVKLAEVRGRQAVVQQEKRNGLSHSIQLHTPKDPACWVCHEAVVKAPRQVVAIETRQGTSRISRKFNVSI